MRLIEKISLALLIPCLILAVFLAINGVQEINLSNDFYAFMKNVAVQSFDYKWEIPPIPTDLDLNSLPQTPGLFEFLSVLANIGLFIVKVINALASVINALIQVVEFFVIIIKNWKEFEQALLSSVQVA